MSANKIVRAWKDADYRESLTEAEIDFLPDNPAGVIQLTDEELDTTFAGASITDIFSCVTYCWWTIVGPVRCFPSF